MDLRKGTINTEGRRPLLNDDDDDDDDDTSFYCSAENLQLCKDNAQIQILCSNVRNM
jgi:hypothetical protein